MEKDPQGYLAGGLPYARTDARGRGGTPARAFPTATDTGSLSTLSIRRASRACCCKMSRRESNCSWALRTACSGVMIMERSQGVVTSEVWRLMFWPKGASFPTYCRCKPLPPATKARGSRRRVRLIS